MYLLDTNVCIRYLNGTSAKIMGRLQRARPSNVFLCSVVKAELIYGAFRSARASENLRVLDRFFEPYRSLPFDDRATTVYGRIRSDLARDGQPIGPNDLMIAAIAATAELTLVTGNTSKFDRVIGLQLENWEE